MDIVTLDEWRSGAVGDHRYAAFLAGMQEVYFAWFSALKRGDLVRSASVAVGHWSSGMLIEVSEVVEVGNQSSRQQVRREAREVQAEFKVQRVARERRLELLAVEVLTALGERDAAIAEAERRSAIAVASMTAVEGLTVREVVDWCAGRLNMHEAARLRRLGQEP